MRRAVRVSVTLWIGSALVVLGLAFVDALLVRASATEVAGRQDVAKTPAQDAQPSTRSVREGVYSVAQAVRGEKTFDTQCALCHKPEHFVGDFHLRYVITGFQQQLLCVTLLPHDIGNLRSNCLR